MSEPDLSPPAQASAAGGTTRRPWWRRRLTMGVVAGAAVLVLGAVLLAWPTGSAKPNLLVPPGRPDPVPTGTVIAKAAKGCGVSADTVHRLTPGSRMSSVGGGPTGTCSWYWSDPPCSGWCPRKPGDHDRSVHVELHMNKKPVDALRDFGGQEFPAQSDLPSDARNSRIKTLTGLGDEAVAYYSPGDELRGTLIVFRAANVVASVKYHGVDSTRQVLAKAIPEKTATAGALRAATDVAKSLGAAAHPTTVTSAAPSTTPSIQRYPELCDTVPARLRDLLAPKATPSMQDGSSLGLMSGIHGGSSVACMWQSSSRYLRVTVASATDWRPGAGMAEATREYLRLHYTERATGWNFKPLAGLGEQAFSVYEIRQGAVVFRVRNALVEVDYYGDAISPDRAIKGAYTAATYVARALHG